MHQDDYKTKSKLEPHIWGAHQWGAARWSQKAQKALKYAVIIMGVLLVVGFLLVLYTIIWRLL